MVVESQRVDGVGQLDPKIVVAVQGPRFTDEPLCEIGIDPPVAPLVGVGQGAARDGAANAGMIQAAFLRTQAGNDIAQTLAVG
jgi:hypothetical protein